MNVLGGVKVTQAGSESPFVEITLSGVRSDLSPRRARQLAARLYLAARAAERIAEKGQE